MNDTTPLVSVVIPNRDQGVFLAAAIDSVLRAATNVEAIVVDDGSTDDSHAIVAGYGDRILALATEGGCGACRARNVGLAAAKGRYVKFLDADDYILPGSLVSQARWLARHPADDVSVYGDALWVDTDGRVIEQPPAPAAGISSAETMILHAPLTSAPLHPIEAVRRVGGFDERVPRGQEYDLHLRMWLAGTAFNHVPGHVYAYRQHGRNRISSNDTRPDVARGRLESLLRLVDLARGRFGEPLPDDVRRAFARQLWRAGRRSAGQGATDVAMDAFASATRLDPSVREGSFLYRLLSFAVGPITAETTLMRVKRAGSRGLAHARS